MKLGDIRRPDLLKQECLKYLGERTGTYEFRCHRFESVADQLFKMGLKDSMMIVDVGAGFCEFDYYLRTARNWRGIYVPVDGAIDGTNLETWAPMGLHADFFVCIEVLEHLRNPERMLYWLEAAKIGAVITTPNPETTDVLGMDRTHVTPCPWDMFTKRGWEVDIKSHFGKFKDSILASYFPR